MTTYGPKIAHQGGNECPCDPEAAGRVWYGRDGPHWLPEMGEAYWPNVLVYQLAMEPVRNTVVDEFWADFIDGHLVLSEMKHYDRVRVRVTANLVDGLPKSGSWEAVE